MATLSQKMAVSANHSASRSLREMWDLRAHNSVAGRIGKAALIDIPARSASVRRLINGMAAREFPGYDVIGGGHEQIVLASGKSVLKLVISSNSRDFTSLAAAAEQLQADSETCQSFLGDHWVPTDFDVVTMSGSGRSIITAAQPRIAADRYYRGADELSEDKTVPLHSRTDLVEAIYALHGDTGLLPDLLGTNNVARVARGVAGCALRIVDTIAVPAQSQELPYRAGLTIGEGIQNELLAMTRT